MKEIKEGQNECDLQGVYSRCGGPEGHQGRLWRDSLECQDGGMDMMTFSELKLNLNGNRIDTETEMNGTALN